MSRLIGDAGKASRTVPNPRSNARNYDNYRAMCVQLGLPDSTTKLRNRRPTGGVIHALPTSEIKSLPDSPSVGHFTNPSSARLIVADANGSCLVNESNEVSVCRNDAVGLGLSCIVAVAPTLGEASTPSGLSEVAESSSTIASPASLSDLQTPLSLAATYSGLSFAQASSDPTASVSALNTSFTTPAYHGAYYNLDPTATVSHTLFSSTLGEDGLNIGQELVGITKSDQLTSPPGNLTVTSNHQSNEVSELDCSLMNLLSSVDTVEDSDEVVTVCNVPTGVEKFTTGKEDSSPPISSVNEVVKSDVLSAADLPKTPVQNESSPE
ncbi:unnamed protein product [Protopolystoma xenopodis]|uniref:Uncharacterized protein n=1 Tax=Protopolystoma xenopodis TaxID=117903 RepID=A0A3S5BQG5_9PLAT|nr:unnamed protein product [Protopolystoma xenopodis]